MDVMAGSLILGLLLLCFPLVAAFFLSDRHSRNLGYVLATVNGLAVLIMLPNPDVWLLNKVLGLIMFGVVLFALRVKAQRLADSVST